MNDEYLAGQARALLAAHRYPGADPAALTAVLQLAQPVRLAPGTELCREGDSSTELFILIEGVVRVARRDGKGHPRDLATLEAPALVGQMAVVDGSPRSATCTAVGPVRALALDRSTYVALVAESSPRGTALRRLLLCSLSQQLTGANRHLRRLVAGTDLEEDLPGLSTEDVTTPGEPTSVVPEDREAQELLAATDILEGWKKAGAGKGGPQAGS